MSDEPPRPETSGRAGFGGIRPGLRGELSWLVTADRTAAGAGHDAEVAVFSTPHMGLLAELACGEALTGRLPAGTQHVGTVLEVHHLEASPAGFRVTARAELTEVEGRTLTFRVEISDEVGRVGYVVHRRMLVDWRTFVERLGRRTREAGGDAAGSPAR